MIDLYILFWYLFDDLLIIGKPIMWKLLALLTKNLFIRLGMNIFYLSFTKKTIIFNIYLHLHIWHIHPKLIIIRFIVTRFAKHELRVVF